MCVLTSRTAGDVETLRDPDGPDGPAHSRTTATVPLTFIRVLVETAKSVYLVVSNICNRRIHETGGLGADCRDHLRFVTVWSGSAAADRARGHEEGIAIRASRAGRVRVRQLSGRRRRSDGGVEDVRGKRGPRSRLGHW